MLVLGMNTVDSMTALSLIEDNKVLSGLFVNEKKKTASMLIPYIDYILKQVGKDVKELDLISVCSGPGSYTSLRIGYSTAKSLCIVNEIKLVEVSKFRLMIEKFLEFDKKKINPINLNIITVLPTTHQKIMAQSFYYNHSSSNLKVSSNPAVKSLASIFEVYNELNTIVIGELKNHKKADDFVNITNLDNYYEYQDRGESSTILAEVGLKYIHNGKESDPKNAQPLYLQSPY